MPSATACFGDDFEACIAHLRMPITHRRAIRTTNLLERLFVEERRRLKIIPSAFGEKAVLKLMFGAMIRTAERWRAIRVSELERRQMRAVREELDREYEAANGLGTKASAPAHQANISSTSRTWPWSALIPPYSLRHLQYVTSLIPSCRIASAIDMP